MRNDFDLALTLLRDLNDIAKIPYTAIDLNLVLKEFLESGDIEDLVAGGLRSIDDKLCPILAYVFLFQFDYSDGGRTFFVTLVCLPLGPDFYIMILAYCFTPQPQRGGPTAKQCHVHTVCGAIVMELVAKK